ncbi:MAG: hypothetical protein IKV53_01645 [Clostridia bacterium]|nr:hypothetical protein [Clostridia bacterium]
MKKFIVALMLCLLLFVGCKDGESIDYSEYSFTDVVWTRDAGNDIETLIFKSDGGFVYYCSCGNPVNDSDLCEGYVYNDETKEIKFECFETTEEMVTSVKIVWSSEDALELDFNGEIRSFERED